MNFATLQGLTIPEGVVKQITDASGRVLWAVRRGTMAVLQVEKITSDTYAGETTYTGEQFILLDIYPKTNGTVRVTYGGLTKTITDTSGAAEPNAQQVFFGTFNGVADSVTTPASGRLTIEGDCYSFDVGTFSKSDSFKNGIIRCDCVTAISDCGNIKKFNYYAFSSCAKLTTIDIDGVVSIGNNAFYNCDALKSVTIPTSVESIGEASFSDCGALEPIIVDSSNAYYSSDGVALFNKNKTKIIQYPQTAKATAYTIPNGVTRIGSESFYNHPYITNYTIPASVNEIGTTAFYHPIGLKRTFTFLGTTPPTLPSSWAFGSSLNTFVVPKGCGDAYRAAGYVRDGYDDYIVEAS